MERRPGAWHPFRGPGWCGLRGSLFILTILTLVIVGPILWHERYSRTQQIDISNTTHLQSLNRTRRSVSTTKASSTQSWDPGLNEYGGVELNYTIGTNTTFQFDLCSIIKCGSTHLSW